MRYKKCHRRGRVSLPFHIIIGRANPAPTAMKNKEIRVVRVIRI